MAQITQDFRMPRRIKIATKNGEVTAHDAVDLENILRSIKSDINSLAAKPGGSVLTGPVNLSSNKIMGVVNSDAPASDEAVAYSTAQGMQVFRPASRTSQTGSQVAATDGTIRADATTGPQTYPLPAASSVSGKCYTIKKVDASANGVTVAAAGTDRIDGAVSYALTAQYKYVTVQSNGSGWDVVANN